MICKIFHASFVLCFENNLLKSNSYNMKKIIKKTNNKSYKKITQNILNKYYNIYNNYNKKME